MSKKFFLGEVVLFKDNPFLVHESYYDGSSRIDNPPVDWLVLVQDADGTYHMLHRQALVSTGRMVRPDQWGKLHYDPLRMYRDGGSASFEGNTDPVPTPPKLV